MSVGYNEFEKMNSLYAGFVPDLGGVDFHNKVNQPGYTESGLGQRMPVRTEWAQGYPSAGLGQLGASDDLFTQTVGDYGPDVGWSQDGWKPLWAQKWVHDIQRKQRMEWNTLNVHSAREDVFRHNYGTTYNHPGQPYVLNWQPQVATNPIIKGDKIKESIKQNKRVYSF